MVVNLPKVILAATLTKGIHGGLRGVTLLFS